jgi:ornithine decarboxylase
MSLSHSNKEIDRVRVVAEYALAKLGNIDTPLITMDLANVEVQYKRWVANLPRVAPYYAVKCNPDPVLVAFLQSLGCNFDCATKAELDLVVNQLGHSGEKVVFSNPCKLESHIRFAESVGVRRTIIDNMDEILKVKTLFADAEVLIRLACEDSTARSPMSLKFGASRDQVRPLLEFAALQGVKVVGVHFHVGSGCSDPTSYRKALLDARRAFDIGSEYGHEMHLLDLGGGYPGLDLTDGSCKTANNGVHFEEMAAVINSMLDLLFPPQSKYTIIAEPGRFFGQAAQALVNKVMAKSVVGRDPDDGRKLIRYYMTEGLYGTLSCIIFDQQDQLKPYLLRRDQDDASVERPHATMFGPTCDGFDKIGKLDDFPELFVGDRLVYLQFGAYTSSITTRFNGFDPATFFYYKSQK